MMAEVVVAVVVVKIETHDGGRDDEDGGGRCRQW